MYVYRFEHFNAVDGSFGAIDVASQSYSKAKRIAKRFRPVVGQPKTVFVSVRKAVHCVQRSTLEYQAYLLCSGQEHAEYRNEFCNAMWQ